MANQEEYSMNCMFSMFADQKFRWKILAHSELFAHASCKRRSLAMQHRVILVSLQTKWLIPLIPSNLYGAIYE